MGEKTGIKWTHSTFNPVTGCANVSPGCDHCYAETLVTTRMGGQWGVGATRKRTSENYWRQPLLWNARAAKGGYQHLIFCGSLCDWADAEMPPDILPDLFTLWRQTPHCVWLMLTKRIHRVKNILPADWGLGYPNVWMGTSTEDQTWYDTRIKYLLDIPAVVHFISAEPLLGGIGLGLRALAQRPPRHTLDWVIAGGESGAGARPMQTEWARSLLHQCRETGVRFFYKQAGDTSPDRVKGVHHGGDWLDGKQYHEFPAIADAYNLGQSARAAQTLSRQKT